MTRVKFVGMYTWEVGESIGRFTATNGTTAAITSADDEFIHLKFDDPGHFLKDYNGGSASLPRSREELIRMDLSDDLLAWTITYAIERQFEPDGVCGSCTSAKLIDGKLHVEWYWGTNDSRPHGGRIVDEDDYGCDVEYELEWPDPAAAETARGIFTNRTPETASKPNHVILSLNVSTEFNAGAESIGEFYLRMAEKLAAAARKMIETDMSNQNDTDPLLRAAGWAVDGEY